MAEALRAITSTVPPQSLQILDKQKRPQGVSATQSALSDASSAPSRHIPSRPQLAKPLAHTQGQQLSMGALLCHLVDDIERQRAHALQINQQCLEMTAENISQIESAKFQKLKEAALETQKRDTWDFWKKIAYGLSMATSAIIGVSLVASGGTGLMVAGGALLLSSASTATAMLLEEQKINLQVTAALTLASASLGLAGSCGIAFLDPASTLRLITTISQGALSIAHGTTTFGTNYSQSQLDLLSQQLEIIKHQIGAEQIDTDRFLLDTTMTIEGMDITKKAQEILAKHQKIMSRITQGSIGVA